MTTLLVADPGLRSATGHHPGAMETIAGIQGFSQIAFFGYAEADPAFSEWCADRGLTCQPYFKTYLYDTYRKNWSLAEAQPVVRSLADDYVQLLRSYAAGEKVQVLHHTADWPSLLALALAIARVGEPCRAVQHLVFLMFNPGVDAAGRMLDAKRQLGYRSALAALTKHSNVQLFTASLEQLQIYGEQFDLKGRIGLHPVFHFGTRQWQLPAREAQAAREPQEAPNHQAHRESKPVLLYTGDAKEAKGFLLLPALAQAMLQHSQYDIVVQVGLDERLCSAAIAGALQELRSVAAESTRLKLIEGYISESALLDLFADSQCLVLNYAPSHYAHQTSGIVWQAAAAKLPVVVIGDSWVSREAPRVCESAHIFPDLKSAAAWLCGSPAQRASNANAAQAGFESYRSAVLRPLNEWLAAGAVPAGFESLWARQGDPVLRGAVLFIDAKLPDPASSAGGYAAVQEMAMFRALGYSVRMLALSRTDADCLQEAALSGAGVAVRFGDQDLPNVLASALTGCQLAFVTRFNVAEQVVSQIKQVAADLPIWLNLADFHGLRLSREARFDQDPQAMQRAKIILNRELAMMQQANVVLSYSTDEMALIQNEAKFAGPVAQLPWVVSEPSRLDKDSAPAWGQRAGLAFLGGFLHAPNVDGVTWFIQEVMPLLRDRLPGLALHVYGSHMPVSLKALGGDNVIMHGYVDSPTDAFDACRVFVAPLRFGAGIKGKVISALAHGVPTVCSSIAAEGIPAEETGLVVCSDPQDWAAQIVALYEDEKRWKTLSELGLSATKNRYSFESGLQAMQNLVKAWLPVKR